ncbi:EAL domain-containing response regulator [Pseudomonas aeruginosa]|uniref:EAL domain-containing response regulator n=1 Tax=Pseudomonas aeruginosa TaxID=287 RepID=UPI0032E3F3FF|nr:EAL domain-containing response regulator [Pseudomonas aeruginosa]HBN9706861.1 EAL domain-containing response regulator [Pseudomonas aeruginosa]HBN9722611.1 EAL domain-containing response regulator [Pseudomonas aeruginosa]HBN9725805.1 EAL domain-containing response regulator [Pseudomonas aeruginosa]HBN9769562.1 EAL domain-containing response regulator [Pseudomonas aeruginosa]
MRQISVLVLEDHPFLRLAAVTTLRRAGLVDIHEAQNGSEALALLKQSGGVDIAICDLQMPAMDGLAFIRAVSEVGLVRAVALSSSVESPLRTAATNLIQRLGLDFIGDLGKSFDTQAVLDVLSAFRNMSRMLPPALPALPQRPTPSPADVRRGLACNEFEAYYQPKLLLRGNQLQGAEILARWNHPRLGLLTLGSFLEVLQAEGLADDLLARMLGQGLEWQRQLRRYAYGKPVELAFNLAPAQAISPGLMEFLAQALRRHRACAEHVLFELAEAPFAESPALLLENLTRLRMLGCGLAMDDFGSGHSSLERLLDLPFTQIKLAIPFTRHLLGNPDCQAIIHATVLLARSLGVQLVATGVESAEQRLLLGDLGVAVGQGGALAPPMTGREFLHYCLGQKH